MLVKLLMLLCLNRHIDHVTRNHSGTRIMRHKIQRSLQFSEAFVFDPFLQIGGIGNSVIESFRCALIAIVVGHTQSRRNCNAIEQPEASERSALHDYAKATTADSAPQANCRPPRTATPARMPANRARMPAAASRRPERATSHPDQSPRPLPYPSPPGLGILVGRPLTHGLLPGGSYSR